MKTKTSNAVIPVLFSTLPLETYTFREIREAKELEKAFNLRYKVLENSENSPFLKKNTYKIDIDVYDLHARHYGLFNKDEKLIACLRVVLDRQQYYNKDAFAVGEKYGFFNKSEHSWERIKRMHVADFPFLSYQNLPQNITSGYADLKRNKEGLAEAGRIVISENYRGVKMSTFLIECAIVLYVLICIGQRHAVICCSREHSLFYRRYGFQPFGQSKTYDIHGTNKMSLTLSLSLSLSLSSIPKYLHEKFEQMAAEFKITGKIQRVINH